MFKWFIGIAVGLCLALGFSLFHPQPVQSAAGCDKSYPDFCIPPGPPDLDCKDIKQKNFTVLQPDPHKLDKDKDGIGCESKRR